MPPPTASHDRATPFATPESRNAATASASAMPSSPPHAPPVLAASAPTSSSSSLATRLGVAVTALQQSSSSYRPPPSEPALAGEVLEQYQQQSKLQQQQLQRLENDYLQTIQGQRRGSAHSIGNNEPFTTSVVEAIVGQGVTGAASNVSTAASSTSEDGDGDIDLDEPHRKRRKPTPSPSEEAAAAAAAAAATANAGVSMGGANAHSAPSDLLAQRPPMPTIPSEGGASSAVSPEAGAPGGAGGVSLTRSSSAQTVDATHVPTAPTTPGHTWRAASLSDMVHGGGGSGGGSPQERRESLPLSVHSTSSSASSSANWAVSSGLPPPTPYAVARAPLHNGYSFRVPSSRPTPPSMRMANSPPATSPVASYQGVATGSPGGGYTPHAGSGHSAWGSSGGGVGAVGGGGVGSSSGGGSGSGSGSGSGGGSHTAATSYSTPSKNNFVATMDLDESLRALYFAPTPMAVLDYNRQIKMLNRAAELIMGMKTTSCQGQRLDRWIAQQSKHNYTLTLNEAAQSAEQHKWGGPVLTRVSVWADEETRVIDVDLAVSPWFSTDPMFEGSEVVTPRDGSGSASSPATSAKDSSGLGLENNRARGTAAPLLHEAMFTISLVPVRVERRPESPSGSSADASKCKEEVLREAVLHTIDTPVMALSADGSVMLRNAACDVVLKAFVRNQPAAAKEAPPKKKANDANANASDARGIDFSWLTKNMVCYDENFVDELPEDRYPIYRSAILGERTDPVIVGCVNTETEERRMFCITGKPMRDAGGFGKHIGGLITIQDVTEERRERHKDAVALGDAYFKQTCDAMPQLVWVTTPTGYHEWYSKSWYEFTGTTEHDSAGVGWTAAFHPDDMPETSRRWGHSLRTGEPYETAYRCLRRDGVWRWMLGRAQPLRDPETGEILKWFGTCTDIHDQVEALAASRQAQRQIESVINQAAMTLWAVDREGIVTVAEGPGVRQLRLMAPGTPAGSDKDSNAGVGAAGVGGGGGSVNGMARLDAADHASETGAHQSSHSTSHSPHRPQYSMLGRSIYTVWGSPDIRAAIGKALEGESVTEEMEVDGRWFRTTYSPLRAAKPDGPTFGAFADNQVEAEIIGVVGASMDITERKHAQQKVEESLLEKSRALAAEGAAREASRLKSEFLANMSHEIRTPIAGVIGLSELLLDEKLTPQQRDYAETIQRSAEGLLTVINDVLDFSKVEIGKLDVERAPFNLEVVLRDQKRMLSFATQKKGLDFRESIDLKYTGLLLGDAGRVRQVMTNLLTNAIKFTSQGFISLDVAQVDESDASVTVRFDVRDSGCGIPADTLSRLFQPFSQADPSTARRFGGTGLGLSISKNLVELMRGQIGLDSEFGKGSHAWFLIPFQKAARRPSGPLSHAVAAASVPAHVPALPGAEERTPLTRPRKDIWILIAEDNLVNAQIASKNLKRMGFSCRTAENGLLALEELEKHPYDAVLMDCQMPECDGYEATRRMRQSKNPDIRILPVIALTASAIKGDRERALEAGMNDYLAKPVKRPALESTLCRWLYDQDARQSLSKWCQAPKAPAITSHEEPARGAGALRAAADSDLAESTTSPSTMPPPSVGLENGAANEGSEFPFSASRPTPATHFSQMALSSRSSLGERSPDIDMAAFAEARRPSNGMVLSAAARPGTSERRVGEGGSGVPLDNLGAAAALLAARRASDETGASIISRPALSPRSLSYQSRVESVAAAMASGGMLAGVMVGSASAPYANAASASRRSSGLSPASLGPAAAAAAHAQQPTMLRRSSREQAGLGRDYEGEIHRQLEGQPRLDEAMRSTGGGGGDEAAASLDHARAAGVNGGGGAQGAGQGQDRDTEMGD